MRRRTVTIPTQQVSHGFPRIDAHRPRRIKRQLGLQLRQPRQQGAGRQLRVIAHPMPMATPTRVAHHVPAGTLTGSMKAHPHRVARVAQLENIRVR